MKHFLLFLITLSFFCQTQLLPPPVSSATTLPFQLTTLISIKSTIIDPSNHLHDWKIPSNNHQDRVWCTWTGINCHPKTAQITSLDLSGLNLSGTISPQTFKLTELRTINISYNYFNSTFPLGISKLRFLKVFDAFDNNFSGPHPQELVNLPSLEQLNLGGNHFSGRFPSDYGNFKRLKSLVLAGNELEGSLPTTIGFLSTLQHMEIGNNRFSGKLPVELKKLENLRYLDISTANISGVIPDLSNMTRLDTLLLFKNHLSGQIPSTIGKLKSMKDIDLSCNWLTGQIPKGIGELPKLTNFIVFNNSFGGTLPSKLGSNGMLKRLDVSRNSLQGPIPWCICRGNNLVTLNLFNNKFNNTLPPSLANCSSLIRVRIENNHFTGSIPQALTLLPNLSFLDASNNNFRGEIPRELGNLQYLNISGNSFQSVLPRNLWKASNLRIFSASFASIKGRIPSFLGCKMVYKIQLDGNFIKGPIPFSINQCKELSMLNLNANELKGIIPDMPSLPLIDVDLSQNNLTGTIPSSLSNCITLESFNVSFNSLTGPIPSSGIFPDLNQSSYTSNQNLCGRPLDKPCAIDDSENKRGVHRKKKIDGTTVRGVIFGMILWVIVIFAGAYFYKKYSSRYKGNANQSDGLWEFTAFQQLNFTMDDLLERMETADIIGKGSTGTVHKAEMPGGEIIAVKVILTKQDTVSTIMRRGVLAEVGVLGGNVRHRNIVKLLGCCSNKEKTMLLYNYMENGNLDEFLHAENNGDNMINAHDWVTRYKIALGVAHGISYLHHDCNPVVVHRDIKPSNILLDSQMEAKVADFGIAKLIRIDELESTIIGTHGYIAPENAERLQVDEKTDIYSYGVVLMELISGKRALNEEFGEGKNIVDWVDSKLKTEDGIDGILDKNAGADRDSVKKEMTNMLRIALLCTSRHRADRPSMRDVLSMLQKQKDQPRRESNDIDIYNFEVGEGSGDGQT